jgi:hypothetical protein
MNKGPIYQVDYGLTPNNFYWVLLFMVDFNNDPIDLLSSVPGRHQALHLNVNTLRYCHPLAAPASRLSVVLQGFRQRWSSDAGIVITILITSHLLRARRAGS